MHLIHEYGLVSVAAIIGLECLGLPVPGETALLAAAIYAGTKHDLNINAVIGTAAAAAMAGRLIGYVIGHKFGSRLLLRYGHYLGRVGSNLGSIYSCGTAGKSFSSHNSCRCCEPWADPSPVPI
jgi:membrane protein DedA with SNARE-associated domain